MGDHQVAARFLARAGLGATAVAVLALVVGGPADAQQQPPSTGAQPPPVKFFIVPHAANPDDVTLFKIAEQALGDGRRFPEIFQLNQGRPRPDGTPFTDPAQIEPGQILQLPGDAKAPNVQFGPLPPAPPPARSAPIQAAAATSGNSLGPALATGTGGLLLGFGIGLFWRRRPRIVPPPEFEPDVKPEPSADDEFEPHTGTLPRIPVVLPRSAPDLTPELFTGPPTGGESYVFFDDADTQVIAAVSPGSRFRFMIGKREPEVRGTTYSKPVLIIDEEADDEG